MQSAVLRALEFDRIREALAREAATPLGRERAFTLEPATDPADVRRRLEVATEALAFEKSRSLALDGPEDLDDVLDQLGIADQPLAPLQLLGLARFMASVGSVVDGIRGASAPLLSELVASVRGFDDEISAVRRAVQPSGDVDDNASTALRDIRDALRRQRSKLRTTLDGLVRRTRDIEVPAGSDRQRPQRPVRHRRSRRASRCHSGHRARRIHQRREPVPRADDHRVTQQRHRGPGRAREGRSASDSAGPDGCVPQPRRGSRRALAAAAEVDELHAKARFAARIDGVAPELTDGGHLEFRGARHPLLIPAVRDLLGKTTRTTGTTRTTRAKADARATGPSQVVASNLLVSPPARALVISGPNTGGKTVALKAFGLLAVMAQAGILIRSNQAAG